MNSTSLKPIFIVLPLLACRHACSPHRTARLATDHAPFEFRIVSRAIAPTATTPAGAASLRNSIVLNVELINLSKGGRSSKSFIARRTLVNSASTQTRLRSDPIRPQRPARPPRPSRNRSRLRRTTIYDAIYRRRPAARTSSQSCHEPEPPAMGRRREHSFNAYPTSKWLSKWPRRSVPLVDLHARSIKLYELVGEVGMGDCY